MKYLRYQSHVKTKDIGMHWCTFNSILFIYLNIRLKIRWICSDYLFYYSVASTVDFEHIIVDWVCTSYNVPIFHSTKNQISHQGSFVQCSFQNFLFLRTLLKKSIALLKKCFNILDASILSVWHLALDLGSYFHLNILTEDLWSFHLIDIFYTW